MLSFLLIHTVALQLKFPPSLPPSLSPSRRQWIAEKLQELRKEKFGDMETEDFPGSTIATTDMEIGVGYTEGEVCAECEGKEGSICTCT